MRKKTIWTGAVMAAAVSMVVSVTGCGSHYQQMDPGKFLGDVQASGESSVAQEIPAVGEALQLAELAKRETIQTAEPLPAMTGVDETVYVTGTEVNLRAAATTKSDVLAVMNRGQQLRRTGMGGDWSRVVYDGMTGYISSQYVSAEKPETTTTGEAAGGSAGAAGEAAGAASGTTAVIGNGQSVNAGEVYLDSAWKYADFSKINTGAAKLYRSEAASRKNITVCVNAGHGTSGGGSVKTLCHPDGTPKVTGGTTSAGATTAVAVSSGMTFSDGTPEAKVTLAMAKKFKEKLLAAGYDVLMIRESDDVQLDNIARTVLANNMADCHIALHWDSTTSNKGAFYMSVPNVSSYRKMEPVASNWEKHNALGEDLVAGLKNAGVKIFSGGSMEMDLTQTSFSTVPSIDIELGDKASDHSDATLDVLADGLLAGVDQFFAS